MSNSILTHSPRAINTPTCPNCGNLASYSSNQALVRCQSCQRAITLNPQQNSDMLDAIWALAI